MKKYLKIYKILLRLNIANLMAYRANFVNSLISSVVWGGFSIISIALLTSRSSSILGWTRDEILILSGSYAILIGVFHTFFSRNFDRLSNIIHFGQLDAWLVKPADSQFLVSVYWINFTSIFRIILGLLFNLYILQKIGISITFLNFVLYLFFLLLGVMVLYSIWFIVLTLLIWFTRLSNLVDFMFNITGVSRFPQEIFKEVKYFVFLFLLPITIIINSPTKFFLLKASLFDLILLFTFSVLFLYVSRRFWEFALRYYTSASG